LVRLPRFARSGLNAVTAVFAVVCLLGAGCSSDADSEQQSASAQQSALETTDVPATPADTWSVLLQKTPYPYLLPLPAPTRTILDGTYTKFEQKEAPAVHCLRCPDYAPEGGLWKLNLDKGIFRIVHEVTGWQSIGSFVLAKDTLTSGASDHLVLFNDPTCPGAFGLYAWELEDGRLILKEIEDECSIHLRAMNLTNLPWRSCRPPPEVFQAIEAGITDHWPKPPGCD
jgi:hypothetical protein